MEKAEKSTLDRRNSIYKGEEYMGNPGFTMGWQRDGCDWYVSGAVERRMDVSTVLL